MNKNKSDQIYKPTEEIKKKISETCKKKGVGKWMKGRKLSKEIRQKMSQSRLGRKFSKKTREKLRQSHIGLKHTEITKRKISKNNRRYQTKETKKKIGLASKGNQFALGNCHKLTDETKLKMSKAKKGRKFTKEHIKKLSGSNSCHWKGGVQKNQRNDPAYHQWVKQVKKRDNNTCWLSDENCKGYNIVHHIFGWTKYKKLRYELTNGITLCQAHHPTSRVKEKLFKRLFSYLVNQK